jgi:hypothetical protein
MTRLRDGTEYHPTIDRRHRTAQRCDLRIIRGCPDDGVSRQGSGGKRKHWAAKCMTKMNQTNLWANIFVLDFLTVTFLTRMSFFTPPFSQVSACILEQNMKRPNPPPRIRIWYLSVESADPWTSWSGQGPTFHPEPREKEENHETSPDGRTRWQ